MAINKRADYFLEDFSPLSQALSLELKQIEESSLYQLVMFTSPSRMRSVLDALILRLLRDMGMLEYHLL